MYHKKNSLTLALLLHMVLFAPWVSASEKNDHEHEHEHDDEQEHRQHDAHVHGIGKLNLALEGREVHVELDSPAANIVGFEHAPSSEADHAALDKAVATLKKGDQLFSFNNEAGCQLEDVQVASALLEEEHEEHAKEDPDKHSHEKKEGHDHDQEEHENEVHSDIEAAYHFTCTEPDKIMQLTVEIFEAFPGTEKLKVQYVVENKQGAGELTATNHVVNF